MCLPAAVCSGLTNLRSADLRLLSDDEPHALCCSTEPAGLHLANVPSSALDLRIHLQCEIRIVWAALGGKATFDTNRCRPLSLGSPICRNESRASRNDSARGGISVVQRPIPLRSRCHRRAARSHVARCRKLWILVGMAQRRI